MRKLFNLTRILLKNDNIFSLSDAADRKKLLKSIALILILALSFLPMAVGFGTIAAAAYDSLSIIGQQGLIPVFGFSAVSTVIFIFGIFYIMSIFYFSTDVMYLIPLPLKPYQIIGAKFVTVLIYEYITEILFLLPIVLVYGVKSSAGILFYLYGIIVFLALPIFPLVAAALIDMVLMRFSPVVKNKDLFKTISSITAIFVAIGFSSTMTRLQQSGMSPEKIQQLALQGNNSLISSVSALFVTSKYAGLGMAGSSSIEGLIFMIIFIVINIMLVLLLLFLGQSLYLKGAVGLSEASSKRKKLKDEKLDALLVKSSSFKSYLTKEIRLLFRTPAYFINCVLMNFIWPIFFLIPYLTEKGYKAEFSGFSAALQDPGYYSIIVAAASAAMVIITSINSVAATSISREGSNFYINKYIPVPYKTQIMAKVMSGVILSVSGMILAIGAAAALFRVPFSLVLIVFVSSTAGIVFSCFTGIIVDLLYPKLVWVSEQKAVKQNFNGILSTLFSGALAAIAAFILIKAHLGVFAVWVILTAFYIILNIVMYYIIGTYGVKRFRRLID